MKKNPSLILGDEFIKYCELNEVTNVPKLAKETFDRGFSILKFGETPIPLKGKETIKEVEKEVIKEIEVIREVEKPVEVIKEIEKIVEVEVPVEKEVYITDDQQVKELGSKIAELEKQLKKKPKEVIKEVEKIVEVNNEDELSKLKEENKGLKDELEKLNSALNKFNKATYLKNSNLSSLYDE